MWEKLAPYLILITLNYKRIGDSLVVKMRVCLLIISLQARSNLRNISPTVRQEVREYSLLSGILSSAIIQLLSNAVTEQDNVGLARGVASVVCGPHPDGPHVQVPQCSSFKWHGPSHPFWFSGFSGRCLLWQNCSHFNYDCSTTKRASFCHPEFPRGFETDLTVLIQAQVLKLEDVKAHPHRLY